MKDGRSGGGDADFLKRFIGGSAHSRVSPTGANDEKTVGNGSRSGVQHVFNVGDQKVEELKGENKQTNKQKKLTRSLDYGSSPG